MSHKVGDLVVVDKSLPQWAHLSEKPRDYYLLHPGIITEVRTKSYVVRFANCTAFLTKEDLIVISEKSDAK